MRALPGAPAGPLLHQVCCPMLSTTVRFEHMTDEDISAAAADGTLVERACNYAQRTARRWAAVRCGGQWGATVAEEAQQEAVEAVLEVLSEHSGEGASVGAIVGARVRRKLNAIDLGHGSAGRDRAWRKVEAAVAVLGKEREADGLPALTGTSLADAVWDRFVTDRAGTNATAVQRKQAERALTQSGVRSVVFDHLTTVVAAGNGPVSLDRPTDDGSNLAEMLEEVEEGAPSDSELVDTLLCGMPATKRAVALDRFGASGVPGAPYDQLAATYGLAKHEVKDTVADAASRLRSPHVWYGRFNPSIDDQFDDGPVGVHDVVGQVSSAMMTWQTLA